MEFGPSDSSGTDDDFPPPLQNRGVRQHMTGNGRTTVGAIPYARVQSDMEIQIHRLEQEAYTSVLRAFKAQSDAITWEKESLITELRKELKVSDEEHRELLNRVNADDIIRRIREWRQEGGHQSGVFSNVQSDVPAPSPTISASRKRQRTQPVPSLSLDVPSTGLHSQPVAVPMQPSPSAAKRTTTTGPKGKKSKTGQAVPGASSMKSMQYSSSGPSGRGHMANKNSSSAPAPVGLAKTALYDPLIGRKVMTRWPDDNNFYEAVIHDYNSVEGLHALVYDVGTEHETWEWVNLKEIPPEDLRWDCDNPGISHRPGLGVAPGVPERGAKKPSGRSRAIPGAGRGRGIMKNQAKKPIQPPQDGIGKNTGDIEILDTKILIKEVEKVFSASQPDPKGMKDAKNLLKTHEQSLIAAIARLADVSDGESEGGKHQYSHGQSMERDRGWRNHMIARAGEQEGYDGNHLGGDDDDDDT
ncbi:protein EMSY-LIKE 3-like [Zingiber officinale]|uniref:protein EMSY-LIKE 3-like n=1 Tax=Zingiber officinale TaxID=94328 RepID=UPI001C4C6EAD|nr:protein EMSY-LIKE 3-like [Zingiber officinale]